MWFVLEDLVLLAVAEPSVQVLNDPFSVVPFLLREVHLYQQHLKSWFIA